MGKAWKWNSLPSHFPVARIQSHDHICKQGWKVSPNCSQNTRKQILVNIYYTSVRLSNPCFWTWVCFFFSEYIYFSKCLRVSVCMWLALLMDAFLSIHLNLFQNIVLLSAYMYCFLSMPILICEHGSFWYTCFLQFGKLAFVKYRKL